MINSVAILLISCVGRWDVQDGAYFVFYFGFKTYEYTKMRQNQFRETCITVRLVRNLGVCAIITSIRCVIMFQKETFFKISTTNLNLRRTQEKRYSLFSWWFTLISSDKNVKTRIS